MSLFLPFHSSAHQGNNIIYKWESSRTNESSDPFSPSQSQIDGKKTEMYKKDEKLLEHKNFKGYHENILNDFKTVIKKLTCKLSNITYQTYLDNLSITLCEEISKFILLLSNNGEDFSKDGKGCYSHLCNKRQHESISENWPDREEVKMKLFVDGRMKLLGEL